MGHLETVEELVTQRDNALKAMEAIEQTPIASYGLAGRSAAYEARAEIQKRITHLNRRIAARSSEVRALGYNLADFRGTTHVTAPIAKTTYQEDPDFCLLATCGLQPNNGHEYNHTFATADRPLIIAKETVSGLTTGEYYRIHQVNTSSGNTEIYTTDGDKIGWLTGRGTNWEVVEEITT